MPHLAFYATPADAELFMPRVFQECRVFESYSAPDEPLRVVECLEDLHAAFDRTDGTGLGLVLYAASMGGEVVVERIDLKPGAIAGKSWREKASGWGVIRLQLSVVRKGRLQPSSTNHNSESRARAWAQSLPQLPPVGVWNFKEVARISRRINRHISALGTRKVGARPVLPDAGALSATGRLIIDAA